MTLGGREAPSLGEGQALPVRGTGIYLSTVPAEFAEIAIRS